MASSKERLRLLNRQGHAPKLRDNITNQTSNGAVLKFDSSTTSWYAGDASGDSAPSDANYVVFGQASAQLQNDRVLASGNGVQFTDGGAGGSLTADLFFTGQSAGDVLLRNATEWVRVPQGTEGQLFTVSDSGISWADQKYGFPKHISEGAISTAGDGVLSVCSFRFDPNNYPGLTTFRFQAVLSRMITSDQNGVVARVRLYNPTAGNYITNSTLTASSTTPTTVTSSAISVVTGENASDGFNSSGGVYELHLDISNAPQNSADTAILGFAGIIR